MKIAILGGDGFVGWPTSLHLSDAGHEKMTGAKITYVPNPRKEADENELIVRNDKFLELGLNPIKLEEGLMDEVVEVARKYAYRLDRSRIPATAAWTKDIAPTLNTDPEGKALRSVS